MATPNVWEMISAIRGQPNRGLRDLSSTIAWISASLGPFGPGFFGHGLDENSRRYSSFLNENGGGGAFGFPYMIHTAGKVSAGSI